MDVITILYNTLSEDRRIFEPKAFSDTFDAFHERYIDPLYKDDYGKGADCYSTLTDVISIDRQVAFEAGFKAAVNLFMTNTMDRLNK